MNPERTATPDPVALETNLRAMPWKQLVDSLKRSVVEFHRLEELPVVLRRWLEADRDPQTEMAAVTSRATMLALQHAFELGLDQGWLTGRTEHVPIAGWVISACRFAKDEKPWWLLSGQRHADDAPLIGPVVPAPASKRDLRKLDKIITYAGGNPKRELFRTGPLTEEERLTLQHDYGQVFFWWKA